MDRTTEKLRSKHVRTLELLQKTLDENAEMKDKLAGLAKCSLSSSSFQLSLGQGVSLADRLKEAEVEIERLKVRHSVALQQQADAAAESLRAAELLIEQHMLDKKFNMTSNVEVAQRIRQQLADKEAEHETEKRHLTQVIHTLQNQVQELQAAQAGAIVLAEAKQRADDNASRSMEAKRVAEVECVRLADMIEKMKKNEWAYASQVESLKAQTLVFEAEHTLVYQKLETRDRQIDMMQKELAELRQKTQLSEEALQVELRMAAHQAETLAKAQQRTIADDSRASNLLNNNHSRDSLHQSLARENQALRDEVAQLRADLHKANASKSGFATHVDLKKENFLLRQQVEEMQAIQKKFLGSARKNNLTMMSSLSNQRG
ncbi:hypothetical protein H310_01665 [Aphanomyces invadans]|uniref:Uncharacterized protein n=1 Tax=Aphanomyces invadans TaxID=157072 RepID=A0A024US13_9STRA|nr:hypothetical protein H310_01665 [Aphanomyces invadans]ETW09266.1 hypothetical protein H310_01665 [Aphanomyces invadans]|eukprot:XP_008863071.1 hypothetical protein H310_01665 [Aphanomyces invadans]